MTLSKAMGHTTVIASKRPTISGQIGLPHTYSDVGNYRPCPCFRPLTRAKATLPMMPGLGMGAGRGPPIQTSQIRLGAHETRLIAGGTFDLRVNYSNVDYNGGLDVDWAMDRVRSTSPIRPATSITSMHSPDSIRSPPRAMAARDGAQF